MVARTLALGACAMVAAVSCKSSAPDLGTEPHLLGSASKLRIGMPLTEVRAIVPGAGDSDVTEGPYTLRVIEDGARRVESIFVLVDLSMDAVIKAWGPGSPGTWATEPARFYNVPSTGLRFTVFALPSKPSRLAIIARRLIPLADVLTAGSGTTLLGEQLFDRRSTDVITALTARGVFFERLGGTRDVTLFATNDKSLATEYGAFSLTLSVNAQGFATGALLELSNVEQDGRSVVRPLLEARWGTPTTDESGNLNYPGEHPSRQLQLRRYNDTLFVTP